jgi:hypothetical protein
MAKNDAVDNTPTTPNSVIRRPIIRNSKALMAENDAIADDTADMPVVTPNSSSEKHSIIRNSESDAIVDNMPNTTMTESKDAPIPKLDYNVQLNNDISDCEDNSDSEFSSIIPTGTNFQQRRPLTIINDNYNDSERIFTPGIIGK